MRTRMILLGLAVLGLCAASAQAGFTFVPQTSNDPPANNFPTILNAVYGPGFAGSLLMNYGDPVYTNGPITATRVDDYLGPNAVRVGPNPGGPGAPCNVVTSVPGMPVTDQVWDDGTSQVMAVARWAANFQDFGYLTVVPPGVPTRLFTVVGPSGINPLTAPLPPVPWNSTGKTWYWLRDVFNAAGGAPHSSLEAANLDGCDHMLTYQVTGLPWVLNPNETVWLLWFEDLNLGASDWDYQDLVVEVRAVPAPAAVLLGGIGLGLVGWLKRRSMA